jgi:acetoacetate decarboxylase
MYEVSAEQTSAFGAFSLTYLTGEIDGHDRLAADGALPIPGRFFAYYWNSSPRMRLTSSPMMTSLR